MFMYLIQLLLQKNNIKMQQQLVVITIYSIRCYTLEAAIFWKNKGSMRNRSPANSQSYFSILLVYGLIIDRLRVFSSACPMNIKIVLFTYFDFTI